jgi:NAD-dependent DNA ligase
VQKKVSYVKLANGKTVRRSNLTTIGNGFDKFLEKEIGYEVITVYEKDENRNMSKNGVSIPCDNEDCRHFKDRCRGKCTIKINCTTEWTDKNHEEKNIIVSYGAMDIRELSTKTECFLWHLKDELGIEGSADIYGKQELC